MFIEYKWGINLEWFNKKNFRIRKHKHVTQLGSLFSGSNKLYDNLVWVSI